MGVLYGAAYYAEYHRDDRTGTDLDLMKEAGFTVIRVGESVWSTWEPREGEFDLEWLLPVLDGAHSRGIGVILGTPTYAVPPWLQQAYPEIAAARPDGSAIAWGGRQEVDYSHPAFRFHAERVIRAVAGRYAQHPAVIGYQVDNEPGLELFHNHGAFTRFVRRLQQQYGDTETLNREWGLTYWSHRITDFSQLWRPEGNTLPQYDLAWRRYQADLTTEFIDWQAQIVRSYAREGQFVTTCISYPRPAADDRTLAGVLDVTAGNPYYAMQDHLDATKDTAALTNWTTSGVAGLFRQADRLFSSRQERFLVTETNAQSIDGSWENRPAWPGQLRQATLALISRGASMIEYWHWHTLPYGTETYWGGVLPHSLKPGRVYREVAGIGAELARIGDQLDGFVPDADVTLLWSNPSRWALQFFPPLAVAGQPDPQSYERIFDAFHRGVIDAGAQARILHTEQARDLGPEELAARHPVLIAPALYVADDADLELLRDYAAAGGHLVIGVRTGYGDQEARARVEVAPARLDGPGGVHYDEYTNIDAPIPVTGGETLVLSEAAAATAWIDGLIPDGAQTLATYDHPQLGRFPAVVTHPHDAGRITTVGTVPNPALAASLVGWLVPTTIADQIVHNPDLPVTVSSGLLPDGRRAWFLFNWSGQETTVKTVTGESIALDAFGAHLMLG
ncbi:beta-galactosidase [Kineosporia mesophila]|uniref:beta-galactosidase n=1 Tax=Kineosporia mesophila TaxID=566012 RepID=A0ABP7AV46_9ACTN|nr:beta-galactosidase [Kineosporia mesophila]MCD5354098.1 beta-galactosidase [Kineosporia mesophila]